MHRKMLLFGLGICGLFLGSLLVRSAAAGGDRFSQNTTKVTSVVLKANQSDSTGRCPILVTFTGTITTDGPGTVRYTFTRNDGATGPEFSLDFKSAETKNVSTTWTIGDLTALPQYTGWQALKILSPNEMESSHETGRFTIRCQQVAVENRSGPIFSNITPNVVVPPVTRVESAERAVADTTTPASVFAPARPRPSPQRPETASNQTDATAGSPTPASGVFRVTLNGFTVGHETNDGLEFDGKGDEIYVVGEVWVMDHDGNFTDRRTSRSVVIGDPTDHPERQPGGSRQPGIFGGQVGGFRTGDSLPVNEPWRRTEGPYPNRIPMLLWEGTLTQGQNLAVILPSIWEWDSPNPGEIEAYWPGSLERWVNRTRPQLLEYLTSGPQEYLRTHQPIKLNLREGVYLMGGNSPILGEAPYEAESTLTGPVLALSYDSAVQALQTSPADKGLGVFEFRYIGNDPMGGAYTVYLQVERIR